MLKLILFSFSLFLTASLSAQSWQDVGGGSNNSSHCMANWNGMLIDGGSFGSPCGRVMGWNGSTWTCFAGGVGLVCRDAIEYNGNLVVCGDFWNINQPCVGCNGIAQWDGTQWLPLGTGFNNDVLCLTIWNGQLVAGGDFLTADGVPSDRIAVWNGTNWYSLGGFTTTFDNDVRALTMYNGELWAGGDFSNAGGCGPCDKIVKWDGVAWVGGGAGVDIPGGLDSTVRVLYVNPAENKLYLGGHFIEVGGNTACSRVAVYDGSVWAPLGTGVDDYVRGIMSYNGNIIVGGNFTDASGTPANKIAKWNPGTGNWSAMGTGMNDYVKSMGVYNGTFYAGGAFTQADGQPRAYIASWYETPAIPPTALFSMSDNIICAGECIDFTDLSTDGPTSWNWTFPTGTPPTSTLQNPTGICFTTPGFYTVTLTATNAFGSSSATQTLTVSSMSVPVVTTSTTPSSTICSGNSATITASGASTYTWAPASGLSATTGVTVVASPTTTTTYTVTGSNAVCSSTTTVTITVNTSPTVTSSPSAITICPSSSIPLTASGGISYTWSPALGLSATTGANVTASPTATTSYTVVGTAANGCTSSSISTVTVGTPLPLPLVEGFESAPFLPSGWTMVDDGTDGNIWAWNNTVGGFGLSTNCSWYANHTVNAPNTLDEMRTMSCNFASLSTAQMTFDVAYCRKSNASFSDTLIVYASTDCGVTWTSVYSKGGSTLATAPNSNSFFTPTSAQWRNDLVNLNAYVGQTNVMFAFQNRNHNGNNLYIDNINITGTTTTPPVAAFSASADSICLGGCVNFNDLTTGLPTSWSWTFPGGTPATSTLQNPPNICWSVAGTYTVSLVATNSNGNDTAQQVIEVYVPTINAGPDVTICVSGSTTLNATGGVSYVWTPAAGLSCTTCASPLATPAVSTTYVVTGTDANGCTNTDNVVVTIDPCTGISAANSNSSSVNVFPNPFTGILNVIVKSTSASAKTIEVYNLVGEKIISSSFSDNSTTLDFSKSPQGIYFILVSDESSLLGSVKAIAE